MSEQPERGENRADQPFSEQAELPRMGLLRELWDFMAENKKWWLTPIIVVLLLVGILVVLGGSGVAPFIYTLF